MCLLNNLKTNLSIASKVCFVFSKLLFVSACTWGYTATQATKSLEAAGITSHHEVIRDHIWLLPQNSSIYLAYPQFTTGMEQNPISMQVDVLQSMALSINKYFNHCQSALLLQVQTVEQEQAIECGADFIFRTSVDYIEDRDAKNTSFWAWLKFAKKDRIALSVKIYDAQTDHLLDTVTVKGRSSPMAMDRSLNDRVILPAINALLSKL